MTERPGVSCSLLATEIGTLGHLIVREVVRGTEDMTTERRRALIECQPFNAGERMTALEMDSYAPFPFLPQIRTEDRGGMYEFRLTASSPVGCLQRSRPGKQPSPPAASIRQLVANMYALDGAPRITHIWAFTSFGGSGPSYRSRAYGARCLAAERWAQIKIAESVLRHRASSGTPLPCLSVPLLPHFEAFRLPAPTDWSDSRRMTAYGSAHGHSQQRVESEPERLLPTHQHKSRANDDL